MYLIVFISIDVVFVCILVFLISLVNLLFKYEYENILFILESFLKLILFK